MKFSRTEQMTILLTALILAFLSGWFLCRQQEASRVFVPSVVENAVPDDGSAESSSPVPTPDTPLININTADAATLQILPGIGEKRAADIIAYREAHGPFLIPEAVSDVPGIGPSILENIMNLITVEEEA